MKDSGLPWIGKIPEEWEVASNKFVMKKVKEIIPKYMGEPILSLSMKGVHKRNLDDGGKMPATFDDYQAVKHGNLLLCLFDIDVTPRCVGFIRDDCITSPAYSQYKVGYNNITKYYYYYYLMIDNNKVLVHLTKSLRNTINSDQFDNIKTVIPPKSVQQQIANFLDQKTAEIDGLIDKNNAEIENLKQYQSSVITQAVTKGLDPNVPMKDSGIEWIGEIPETWKIVKIKYLVKPVFFKDNLSNLNWRYIGLENVEKNTGRLITTTTNYPDKIYNVCRKGDVLYSKLRPNLAKVLIAPFDSCCTGEFEVLSTFNNRWIKYCLLSDGITKMTTAATYGVKMPRVSWKDLSNYKIPLPSSDVIEDINNYLDLKLQMVNDLIKHKQQQIDQLLEYKKSLIFEYVTGKKQVPQVEGRN